MLLERRCPGCSRPSRFVCDDCWAALDPAPGSALFVYDDLARAILLSAKNHGRRDLFRPLGRCLADSTSGRFDVVTWVPASSVQRRERGYDQGRLLARAAAKRLGCPHRRLLRRFDRQPQTGLTREQRLVGPDIRPRGVVEGSVLLVDDVRTTGASLRAGAAALWRAGAASVSVVAVASAM